MAGDKRFTVEPLDEQDLTLLRYMRRSFNCQHLKGDCPALADCPEGFYICDAISNMLAPGMVADLGPTARRAVRHIYQNVDCSAVGDCPSRERCADGDQEPCEVLMVKLGVVRA